MSSDFYIPLHSQSLVMLGGIGHSVVVKNFNVKPFHKMKMQFATDRKNCECCNIV
jgi:hypothetical protein